MLIHVGSRRSLSTWLRNEIFSNPNFYIIKGYLNKSRITKYFQYTDPAFIDLNELKKDVLQDIENAKILKKIPIIANEALEGNELNGNNFSIISNFLKSISNQETKILYIIRRQDHKILALYKKHIAKGGVSNLKNFINSGDYINRGIFPYSINFKKECLFYDKIIEHYQYLFGEENVLVLPYEMFFDKKDIFVKRILEFINFNKVIQYDGSKRYNEAHNWSNLLLNKFSNLIIGNPTGLDSVFKSKYRNLTRQIFLRSAKRFTFKKFDDFYQKRALKVLHNEINNFYKISNDKTSKLIKINLDEYGY